MGFFDDDIDAAVAEQGKADQEEFDAPKFNPDAGDQLHAVLLKAEPFTKGKYEPTIIITFRNVGEEKIGDIAAGESGVMFCPTVLRRKLLEAQPALNTAFALKFLGKITPEKGGNPYKDWTLFTENMKEADASKVDPAMWNAIEAAMVAAEDKAYPQQTATSGPAADNKAWKF
jgi:hypothetical protein